MMRSRSTAVALEDCYLLQFTAADVEDLPVETPDVPTEAAVLVSDVVEHAAPEAAAPPLSSVASFVHSVESGAAKSATPGPAASDEAEGSARRRSSISDLRPAGGDSVAAVAVAAVKKEKSRRQSVR